MTHKQIDRSNVILNFVSKCSRKNPPFSSKVPITVAIPVSQSCYSTFKFVKYKFLQCFNSVQYDVPEGSGNHPVKQGANKTSDVCVYLLVLVFLNQF